MPFASISQLAAWTGKDRRTITQRIEALDFREGENRSHEYDTELALKLIYLGNGAGGPMTLEQAKKEKELAAAENLQLRNQELRRQRIPADLPLAINEQISQGVAAILKAARGKKLTTELINDIFAQLREIPAQLAAKLG